MNKISKEMQEIFELLRVTRKRLRYSQEQMGTLLKSNKANITLYERERVRPSGDFVIRLQRLSKEIDEDPARFLTVS